MQEHDDGQSPVGSAWVGRRRLDDHRAATLTRIYRKRRGDGSGSALGGEQPSEQQQRRLEGQALSLPVRRNPAIAELDKFRHQLLRLLHRLRLYGGCRALRAACAGFAAGTSQPSQRKRPGACRLGRLFGKSRPSDDQCLVEVATRAGDALEAKASAPRRTRIGSARLRGYAPCAQLIQSPAQQPLLKSNARLSPTLPALVGS